MKYKVKPNKDGAIPKQATADIRADLKSRAGSWTEIIIQDWKKKYSNSQLAYWYGGIVNAFSKHFGYNFNQAHDMLKYWCGWFDIKKLPTGEEVKVIRSITKNEKGEASSTTDLMFLVNTATRLCAEHGLQIETPEEYFETNPMEYK